MSNIALFALTCFAGAMIQSICGFGSGVFAMSVLPHFLYPYSFALVLTTLASLIVCVCIFIKVYKHFNVRMIIPIIIGNVFGTTLVMVFWRGFIDVVMKKVLGFFLILLSLYFIFYKKGIKIKPTLKTGILTGVLGGVLNSFFSVGAPPVVVYLISASKDPNEYISSIQAYFCFSSIFVTISRYMSGMITQDVWPLFLTGLPFIALGAWVGLKLFGKLNEEKLRFIIYLFMAASGAVMIVVN